MIEQFMQWAIGPEYWRAGMFIVLFAAPAFFTIAAVARWFSRNLVIDPSERHHKFGGGTGGLS